MVWQNLVTVACDVPARVASSAAEQCAMVPGSASTNRPTLACDSESLGSSVRISAVTSPPLASVSSTDCPLCHMNNRTIMLRDE